MKYFLILCLVICLVSMLSLAVTGVNDGNVFLQRGFNLPRNIVLRIQESNIPLTNPIDAFKRIADTMPNLQAIADEYFPEHDTVHFGSGWAEFWYNVRSGLVASLDFLAQGSRFLLAIIQAPMYFVGIVITDIVVVVPAVFTVLFGAV